MADWYAIRVQLDPTPTSEARTQAAARLKEVDYDFPTDCLHYDDWFAYRSPMDDGSAIGRTLAEHGLSGRYWLIWKNAIDCSDRDMRDEDVVEFGPDVRDPHERANRAQLARLRELMHDYARRYRAAAAAFGVEPTPVRPQALPLLGILVRDHDLPAFTELVRQLTE